MNKLDLRHKETFRLLIRDYFEIFFPDLAPYMRFETAKFLDKELIDLFGKEEMERRTDSLVLIEMELDGKPEWILIHWEQQSKREPGFEERMFHYFCGIYFRYRKLVFPVAMFTDSARWREPVPDIFQLSLRNYTIVEYRYQQLKLKRFLAEEFGEMAKDSPLRWGYLPYTDYKKQDRVRVLAQAMLGVALIKDQTVQATLLSLVSRSVQLSEEEQKELKRILSEEKEFQEVRMLQSVEEVGFERGIEQGLEQGEARGEARGERRGERRGVLKTIAGFLQNGIGWETIERATGIAREEYERLRAEYLPEEGG